jgi:hypothetical protein
VGVINMPKRILLIEKRGVKNKKIKRIKLKKDFIDYDGFINADIARGVNNYFKNFRRMCCTDWVIEDRFTELYDLNSDEWVGAIYPDGACMIWPMSWYTDKRVKGKLYEPRSEITFSEQARINEAIRIVEKRSLKTELRSEQKKLISDKPKIKRMVLKNV